MKKTLSQRNKERVITIKANIARLSMTIEDTADETDKNYANVLATFKGRYSEQTTDNTLSELEAYLKGRLGVRYIKPYFDDLD